MWLDIPGFEDPPKEDSVFRTVVHGDAWVNNMMFSSNDPEAEDLRSICPSLYYRNIPYRETE